MTVRNLRRLVGKRAHERCEYCGMPQELLPLIRFHIEHIVAKQHGGADDPRNLCFSCTRCNYSKGPNLAGMDPKTGKLAALFHPRRQRWKRHFRWSGPVLVGLTPTGRATIAVLDINNGERLKIRARLMAEGVFPE